MSITSATTSNFTPPVVNIPVPAPKAAFGADFNMFLKLLTTQMQNQDPLSPMDSTQYTQQLAQYSQVEQTVQQTGTLNQILARLSVQDMSQASSFIGKDAVFNSAISGLGAKPASWDFTTDRTMTTGTATITDASGEKVFTRVLTGAEATGGFTWDGTLADGTKAPAGAYKLSITGVDAAGAAIGATINTTGTIRDVTVKDGILSLGVNGIPMSVDTLIRLSAGA